jgi:hypothetical protein
MQQVGYGLGEFVLQFCSSNNIKHQFPGGETGIVMARRFHFNHPVLSLQRISELLTCGRMLPFNEEGMCDVAQIMLLNMDAG